MKSVNQSVNGRERVMNKIRTALGLLFSMVNSGECHSTTSIKVFSEAIEENEQLKAKNLELENNQACSDCLPESYGWNYNAVEGRFPCACISESEAYQKLLADNQRLRDTLEEIRRWFPKLKTLIDKALEGRE